MPESLKFFFCEMSEKCKIFTQVQQKKGLIQGHSRSKTRNMTNKN